jgi:hypothetical protein
MTKDFLTKLIYDNELFHGTVGIGVVMDMNHVEKFAKLVAAEEREKCAKLAEERWLDKASCTAEEMYEMQKKSIAEAIRARGQA